MVKAKNNKEITPYDKIISQDVKAESQILLFSVTFIHYFENEN